MGNTGALLVALVICVVPLAGCVGGTDDAVMPQGAGTDRSAGAGPLVQVLEDAQGDAVEGRPAYGTTTSNRCDLLYRPSEPREQCREVARTLGGSPLPEEGLPAGPTVDILGVSFRETPAYLVVELELAKLEATFEEALPDAGEALRFVAYLGPDLVSEVDFYAYRSDAGDVVGFHSTASTTACAGRDIGCHWAVPFELVEGSPGTIRWFVERELLPDGGLGGEITGQDAGIIRLASAGASGRVGADTPAGQIASRPRSSYAFLLDHVVGGGTFVFETAMQPFPDPARPGVYDDMDWLGLSEVPSRPDLDILRFDLLETPDTITFAGKLARVEDVPEDHYFEADIGLLGGAYFEVYLESWGGEYQDFSSVCLEPVDDCQDWRPVPTKIEIKRGEPGWVNVTVSRHALGPVRSGMVTRYLDIEIATFGTQRTPVGPIDVTASLDPVVGEPQIGDEIDPAPVYRFRYDTSDTRSGGASTTALVNDASGDVEADPLIPAADISRFDVTFLEARGEEPGLTRLTLGVQDLSSVSVPAGYDAAVYAASIETERGPFMVGFYLERGGQQEFFCSQDTLVLVDAMQDPLEVVRQPIDGRISVVDRDDAEGAGASAITFLAPHACFSLEGEGPLAGARMGAGTFLIQAPGRLREGTVHPLDDVERNEALVVQAALGQSGPPAAWYAAPFGLSNFWDMAGIGLAAMAAVTGGALKLQHNRRDKRAVANAKLAEDRDVYKAALVKAVVRGTHDPDADEVLQALRRRLGIGEREHALMLLEARAAAGLADGLDPGATFLGKYRIERVLGEGGFARTFLAMDERLDRRVVLKVARWEDKKEAARALKEGRTLARLNHSNIVTIHDVEEVAGQVVLVLEHVPRGSLAGVLARGPITAAEALSVTHDVLAALEAAHAQGIVHRDVKPANILLGASGHAKLADFGIAGGARGAGTATGASLGGDGAGTLLYMSPEQARGAPADARSDLYSVGVVLYEMLTGRSYIDVDGLGDFEIRKAILEDEPALPIAGAPARVNAALGAALAKDASLRPKSAAEMRRLLA